MADFFDGLKDVESISEDEIENSDETIVEETKEKPFSKIAIITCVASALVAAILGFAIGNMTASPTTEQVTSFREVTSVTAHVPIYEQLETMRESTISSLAKEIEEITRQNVGAGSGAQQLSTRLIAVGNANADVSKTVEPFFDILLKQSRENSTIAMYVANHAAFKGEEANKLETLMLGLDPYLAKDSAGNVITRFVGSNPETQVDIGTKKVSRPTAAIVTSAGGDAEHRTVYLVTIPMASERGELFNALYVVGLNSSQKISYVSYIGIVSTDDEGVLASSISDATTLAVENMTTATETVTGVDAQEAVTETSEPTATETVDAADAS